MKYRVRADICYMICIVCRIVPFKLIVVSCYIDLYIVFVILRHEDILRRIADYKQSILTRCGIESKAMTSSVSL